MRFRGNYYFLSNFYAAPIVTVKWGEWPSAEHLYQACKFLNSNEREMIRRHPAKGLKAFCRTLTSMDPDWNSKRVKFMRRIVLRKFEQHDDLRRQLLDLSGPIVESNTWHDNFWGNCTCARCSIRDGKNMLGIILMELQDHFNSVTTK